MSFLVLVARLGLKFVFQIVLGTLITGLPKGLEVLKWLDL